MAPGVEQKLESYLAEHSVITLATHGPDGPWASPVFYAGRGFALYFVSNPDSRHGRNIGEGARVAAVVTEDYKDWRQIQGIQLEGGCRPLRDARERRGAMAIFVARYPFALGFLVPGSPLYAKAGRQAVFYRLDADRLWFTDNTAGFGHRDYFEPGAAGSGR